jgi:hypothetical protein
MNTNLHDIDKLFKAALNEQEETPSTDLWNSIDQHLDKNKVVDINRKYIQLKKIAVALLILLIGIGAYTLNTWNKSEKLAKADKSKKISIQINDSVSLTIAEPKQESIVLSTDSNKKENSLDSLRLSNATANPIPNKNVPLISTGISQNSITPNTVIQKENKNIVSTGSNKIAIKKRTYKTTITNAAIGEDQEDQEDQLVNKNTVVKEGEDEIVGLPKSLPAINPELLKATAGKGIKQKTIIANYTLPDQLITRATTSRPVKIKKGSSFSATVFYAPNLSSNTVKEETHDRRPGGPANDRDREKIRDGEQHQASLTFGLLVDYNLNKHWSVESGVSITNKKISIEPKTIFAHKDNDGEVKYLFDCSSGYLFLPAKAGTTPIEGDSIKALSSTNTLQYVSIPLAVKYNFPIHKFDLFAVVGTSVNILSKGKIETAIQNGLTKEASVSNSINGLKSNYLGGNVSMGVAYNITDKIGLSFIPSYNFAITSSTKDAAVKSFPNAISLAAGLRFKF